MAEIINQEEMDDLKKIFPDDNLNSETDRWLELRDLMKQFMRNGESEKVFMLFSDLQAELVWENNVDEENIKFPSSTEEHSIDEVVTRSMNKEVKKELNKGGKFL